MYAQDLEDDLVGTAMGGGKLRSNVYRTEDQDWKEITVSQQIRRRLTQLMSSARSEGGGKWEGGRERTGRCVEEEEKDSFC